MNVSVREFVWTAPAWGWLFLGLLLGVILGVFVRAKC